MVYFKRVMGEYTPTVHGAIVSSSLITGAISASLAGVLADKYGRVRMSVIGASIDGVGAAIMCGSPVLGVFILGRLIKGLGDGLFLSAVYVQVTEMSPARYRGILSSIPQFSIVTGLICGYFVCYGTSGIKSTLSWRLPLAIISALAFVFSILACFVPPSPRWLLARGEVDRSRSIATSLGIGQEELDELFRKPPSSLANEMNATLWESVLHMVSEFRVAFSLQYRSRTVFGCSLMAFQQLAGIDGVLYYAPQMFQSAGLTSTEASFLASGVSGLVIFGVTIPACLLADSVKRRTSALTGGVGVTVVMFAMAILYAAGLVHSTHGAARWVVIVCIYLFAIIFNGTWGLTLRIYLVESMPMRTRSSASSLGQSSNWVCFTLSFPFPLSFLITYIIRV